MDLFRAQAFKVPPGRLGGERPAGAVLEITPALRATLGDSLADVSPDRQIRVNFRVDPAATGAEARANVVRTLMLAFAFADDAEASDAAVALADRLCDATDQRSHHCLMVISAARDEEGRQVTIWTFPQEAAFRFEPDQSLIQLLEDVFSQKSDLRKAASFRGGRARDGFMVGWVVDLQASGTAASVADYWIRRFLDCELTITSESGTRLLVRAIRGASDQVQDPHARDQLVAAAAHLPHQPRQRMSLADVADTYLSGEARVAFERSLPAATLARTPFELDRPQLERGLQMRAFELDTGVRLSAPFGEIGRSVRIEDGTLTCVGKIVSDRVRSARGV